MSDVPGPSKRFSTDNSLISVAKKRCKINQDSSLDESDYSSEEAAHSQRNDEDQSDTSEEIIVNELAASEKNSVELKRVKIRSTAVSITMCPPTPAHPVMWHAANDRDVRRISA
ncbi:hypothetical protein EVAR_65980_1 [Eumeta japonica]|uniref:Uncharacterized protein n=1 Tax=Eumeta variegata TaxID=151549 RepID=A0A4C2ADH5_EUMVA|nr:hypothetical protein EVAR_65980_1 [Eumeta japonica]